MLRAIREIQPSWVVGENVRGLTNWNGGLVFDEVQSDLEIEGYEVLPFLLPACAVNAPHRRDRIWFIAHTKSTRLQGQHREWCRCSEYRKNTGLLFGAKNKLDASNSDSNGQQWSNSQHEINASEGGQHAFSNIEQSDVNGNVTNTSFIGQECRQKGEFTETQSKSNNKQFEGFDKLYSRNFQMFPSVAPICNGNDGIPNQLDGITFPKWRNESIKAGGNAIVPQVALQIFKAIQEYENLNK
jgi:DNA (cytosine-5)-methyltransferase 1